MRRGTAAPTAHFLATPSGAPLTMDEAMEAEVAVVAGGGAGREG